MTPRDEIAAAPDDPPRVDHGLVDEHLANGLVVRDRDNSDAYVYADTTAILEDQVEPVDR